MLSLKSWCLIVAALIASAPAQAEYQTFGAEGLSQAVPDTRIADQTSGSGEFRGLVVDVRLPNWSIETAMDRAAAALTWAEAHKKSFGDWARAQTYNLDKASPELIEVVEAWRARSPDFREVILNLDPVRSETGGFQMVLTSIPTPPGRPLTGEDILVNGIFSGANEAGAANIVRWCDAGAKDRYRLFCRDAEVRFCRSPLKDDRCGAH